MSPLLDHQSELMPGFMLRAGERLESMAALVDALGEHLDDRGRLHDLMCHFHALAGLGGTYGFREVSEVAGGGEAGCAEMLSIGRAPSPVEVESWRHAVSAIRAAIARDGLRPVLAARPSAVQEQVTALLVGTSRHLLDLGRDMEREGVEVRIASDSAAVWTNLSEGVPALVVAEAALGESGPYDIVEKFRSMRATEGCVIFIVGESSDFAGKVAAIRCGADAYFDLPVQRTPLLRRVKQLTGRLGLTAARVLHVENDGDHAQFIRSILISAGYDVQICSASEDFENELIAFKPEIVLMDVLLDGEISGYDLSRFMRQDERYATTPLLFLTTEREVDARMKSIRAGADDFILKPIVPALLLTAVASRVERARTFHAMLERDGLTGLLTHSAFLERAKTALGDVQRRPGEQKVLAMIDVDHFKLVNDRYGHPVGDRVLASLGAFLRRRVRRTDTVGRYGGEEFAVVLERVDEQEAHLLLERLLAEFRVIRHSAGEGRTFFVTFSAGVARADCDADVDGWKKAADDALYAAKRSGRNRVVTHAAARGMTAETPTVH